MGLVEGGFRVHQCCHRPHDRLRAREQDDGGLRRLLRARRRGCSCVFDVDGERGRREEGLRRSDGLQGCSESQPDYCYSSRDAGCTQRKARSHRWRRSEVVGRFVPVHSERRLVLGLYSRPLPGASPLAVTKAIDKALVMGASIDSKLLKEAAEAHNKALNGMDSKLVATQADYTAVNAALGKVFASVPTSQVMDTYNAFAKLVDGSVPAKLFSAVNPSEAVRSYDALVEFASVVKAAQR